MNTLDLLTRLNAAGVTVVPAGNAALQLRGRPCPTGLKVEAIAHKAAILATLAAHRIGEPSEHPAVVATIRYALPCWNLACPVLGPCARRLDGRPCPFTEPCLERAA